VGLIVSLLSLFFTQLSMQHLLITITVVILTAALFALGGFINAIFANKFDDISIVPTFILTPLTYLGGVFYSIDLLPEFWRMVSLANPIVYMVNAFRYGVLGVSDVNVYASLGAILAFVVAFYLLALWLLQRGTGIRH
jgi:ABC-2 type transport system permease protein